MRGLVFTVLAAVISQDGCPGALASERSPQDVQQEKMTQWVRAWLYRPPKTREEADQLDRELLKVPMRAAATGGAEPAVDSKSQVESGLIPDIQGSSPMPSSDQEILSPPPLEEVFPGRKPPKKRSKSSR